MKTQLYADILLEAAERIQDRSNVYACLAIEGASPGPEVKHALWKLLFKTYAPHEPHPSGTFIWGRGFGHEEERVFALLLLRERILDNDPWCSEILDTRPWVVKILFRSAAFLRGVFKPLRPND